MKVFVYQHTSNDTSGPRIGTKYMVAEVSALNELSADDFSAELTFPTNGPPLAIAYEPVSGRVLVWADDEVFEPSLWYTTNFSDWVKIGKMATLLGVSHSDAYPAPDSANAMAADGQGGLLVLINGSTFGGELHWSTSSDGGDTWAAVQSQDVTGSSSLFAPGEPIYGGGRWGLSGLEGAYVSDASTPSSWSLSASGDIWGSFLVSLGFLGTAWMVARQKDNAVLPVRRNSTATMDSGSWGSNFHPISSTHSDDVYEGTATSFSRDLTPYVGGFKRLERAGGGHRSWWFRLNSSLLYSEDDGSTWSKALADHTLGSAATMHPFLDYRRNNFTAGDVDMICDIAQDPNALDDLVTIGWTYDSNPGADYRKAVLSLSDDGGDTWGSIIQLPVSSGDWGGIFVTSSPEITPPAAFGIADAFNGVRFNRGKWWVIDAGPTAAIVDGALNLTGDGTIIPVINRDINIDAYSGDQSTYTGNFIGKYVFAELSTVATYGTWLYVTKNDFSNSVGFDIYDGNIELTLDGVIEWTTAYNAVTHKAFKFYEQDGTLYAEYWNGSVWTEVWSVATPAWLNDVRVESGSWVNGSPAGGDKVTIKGWNTLTNARTTPQTYYVLSTGDDEDDGTSLGSAWQTIDRVNQAFNECEFIGGDTIVFEAGETFLGPLVITQEFTEAAPLLLKSTVDGTSFIIDANDEHGVVGIDVAGIELEDITVVGLGISNNVGDGFLFLNTNEVHRHTYLRLTNCAVSGMGGFSGYEDGNDHQYGGAGIRIGGAFNGEECMGYEEVFIEESVAEDCADHGIYIQGHASAAGTHGNASVFIFNCIAREIPGHASASLTGNGIRVEDTYTGIVEECLAHNCGATGDHSSGFYVQRCSEVVFRLCASFENETSTTDDGAGFYIDGGCEDCIIELCYTRNNDGAGYLIISGDGNGRDYNRRNVLRFSISENDGLANQYPAIFLYKDPLQPSPYQGEDNIVHSNTVYKNGPAGSVGAAIRVDGQTDARVLNNIFYNGADQSRKVEIEDNNVNLDVRGNNYYGTGQWRYNDTDYATLTEFRTASSLETGTGTDTDPIFESPGGGTNPTTTGKSALHSAVQAYRLENNSTALDDGVDLDMEELDFPIEDFLGESIEVGQKKAQGPKHKKNAKSDASSSTFSEIAGGIDSDAISLVERVQGLAGATSSLVEHLVILQVSQVAYNEHLQSQVNSGASTTEHLAGLENTVEVFTELLKAIRESGLTQAETVFEDGVVMAAFETLVEHVQAVRLDHSVFTEHLIYLYRDVTTILALLQGLELEQASYGETVVPLTSTSETLAEHVIGVYNQALTNLVLMGSVSSPVATPTEHFGEIVRIVLDYILFIQQALEIELKG